MMMSSFDSFRSIKMDSSNWIFCLCTVLLTPQLLFTVPGTWVDYCDVDLVFSLCAKERAAPDISIEVKCDLFLQIISIFNHCHHH